MASRPRARRSLSNLGGAIALQGEPAAAQQLQAAWQAASGEPRALTHGFHGYPARMHPGLARSLIAALSARGERVLDPFCGSGTVLVEAMLAERVAVGVDLSPLAVRIAALACEVRSDAERARLRTALEQVTAASLARVRARAPARAPLSAAQRAYYEPHVLLELAGLLAEIRGVRPEADAHALEMVFSTLVVKLSRKRGDTSEQRVDKRIRKGLASELFLRKGRELLERSAALSAALPASARAPRIVRGDARRLASLLSAQPPFQLVLGSPPYGGTYDYHDQHALRCAWLGLPAREAERDEIGARRRSLGARAAERWDRELAAVLHAIASVCAPDARVALVIGDAQLGTTRVAADQQLARLGPAAGLLPVASAAQSRRDQRGGASRHEHIVLLRRAPARC